MLVALLLAGLTLGASAGCAGGNGKNADPTKTPRPTFTDAPTATNTPAATATPSPTATLAATATPEPTATLQPTATKVPPTKAPVKPTAKPTATPAPQVGPHGVLGRLRLRENRTTYAVGEQVFFVFEAENRTDKDVPFGILGLKSDGNVPFQTSWTSDVYKHAVKANSVFRNEDRIVFPAAGRYTVRLAICFATYDDCRSGSPDWEEFAPGVVVTIQ